MSEETGFLEIVRYDPETERFFYYPEEIEEPLPCNSFSKHVEDSLDCPCHPFYEEIEDEYGDLVTLIVHVQHKEH